MTVYFSDLDNYGRELDIEMILNKYKIYFDGKYTVETIISAIHRHCANSNIVPKVADINAIINPEQRKISNAEYVEACRWQERNGFPVHSEAAYIKQGYEDQENHFRSPARLKIANRGIQELVSNSIKKI